MCVRCRLAGPVGNTTCCPGKSLLLRAAPCRGQRSWACSAACAASGVRWLAGGVFSAGLAGVSPVRTRRKLLTLALTLLHPALLIVDHIHFQCALRPSVNLVKFGSMEADEVRVREES